MHTADAYELCEALGYTARQVHARFAKLSSLETYQRVNGDGSCDSIPYRGGQRILAALYLKTWQLRLLSIFGSTSAALRSNAKSLGARAPLVYEMRARYVSAIRISRAKMRNNTYKRLCGE